MTKKTHNTGDEAQVKDQARLASNREKGKTAALRLLLGSKGGRDFIWDILVETHMFRTSFTGNNTTFFNEGARNVGLKLLDQVMGADKTVFQKMHKENNDDD